MTQTGLESLSGWGFPSAAAWIGGGGSHVAGDTERRFEWASVTKVITSLAIWVAVEEGTIGWDDEVGPPGATLRHLLAHASGLAADDDRVLAAPQTRRIYSNRGIELAAGHLASASGIAFWEYAAEAVTMPLGMTTCRLAGSAASGASGRVTDLLALAGELLRPTLVAPPTLAAASGVAYPGLAGVLPGFGRLDPNDWGLGVEVRGTKHPHWTAPGNSESTFGHFGRSGSFVWVDPTHGLAGVSLADRPFGDWSKQAWPALSQAILDAAGVFPPRTPRPEPSP